MSTVVGVHGIAQQQRGRHQLLQYWEPALVDGLERALGRRPRALPELDIAFFGDVFLPAASAGEKSAVVDEVMFDNLSIAEMADLTSAAEEALTPADIAAAAELKEPKGYTRGSIPLLRLLAALDARFGTAAGVLFIGELRQVHRYLRSPDAKRVVDERVATAMENGAQILIGHSLGSVVAFEYVRQHPNRPIDMLVTLGSPLALRMVRSHMPDPNYGAIDGRPANVAAWVNIRDPHDPVACAGGLAPWWSSVRDHDVDNEDDAHSVERYLSKKATGEALLAAAPALAAP